MIERYPEGTDEIPYPHKIFHWTSGHPTMSVECDPHMRDNPPKIDGWKPFFIGFHGYKKPMTFSYKPVDLEVDEEDDEKVAS